MENAPKRVRRTLLPLAQEGYAAIVVGRPGRPVLPRSGDLSRGLQPRSIPGRPFAGLSVDALSRHGPGQIATLKTGGPRMASASVPLRDCGAV